MSQSDPAATPPPPWKRRLGLGLLVYSLIPICTVELVALLPLDATARVSLGAAYIGSGELAFLAAVALLGKPFIQAVKDKIRGFFLPGRPASRPRPVGRFRHGLGVAMLLGSLLPYYAAIGTLFFTSPGEANVRAPLSLLLAGEIMFLGSLFVLGGEFWDRLKRLFAWPGPAQQAADPDHAGRS